MPVSVFPAGIVEDSDADGGTTGRDSGKKSAVSRRAGSVLAGGGRRDDVLFARNLQFIVCGRAKMRVVWNAFIIFAIGCTDFGSGRRKP